MVGAHKTDWDTKLASALAYNIVEKTTKGKSPYYLVYGQDPLSILVLELIIMVDGVLEDVIIEHRLEQIEVLEEEKEIALERTREVQVLRKKRFD